MVAQALSPKTQDLARAFQRATVEKIVVYRAGVDSLAVATVADGAWTEKPYHITATGERPQDVVCDCPAAAHGRTCKHIAAAVFARKYHVYALAPKPRPAACPLCGMELANPMHEVFCDA
jgi:hypothetical protein